MFHKMIAFLLMSLIASASQAGKKEVIGLICEDDNGSKVAMDLRQKGDHYVLGIRYANNLVAQYSLDVKTTEIQAILDNDLGKLDNKTIKDQKNKSKQISFRIEGRTFDKKPYLRAEVRSERGSQIYEACLANEKQNISVY